MSRIENFFFAPTSARPLAVFRILTASILLLQALQIGPVMFELFGQHGILQESLASYLTSPYLPRFSWFTPIASKFGINEGSTFIILGVCYVVSLFSLLIGFKTHWSALFAWFFHWIFMNSSYHSYYGADTFAHIFLFYLILMPSGASWSADKWRDPSLSTQYAQFFLRILQLHLCIVYLTSGIDKAMGEQWQNGEVMWRSLTSPTYRQYDFFWVANYPWIAKLSAWGTLAVEIGYPLFIWPKLTREIWVWSVIGLHLGISVFLGLHIFGLLMAAATFAAFGFELCCAQDSICSRIVDRMRGKTASN